MSLPPLFASMEAEGWSPVGLQQAWAAIPFGSIPGALFAASATRSFGLRTIVAGSSILASASIGFRSLADGIVPFSLMLAIYGFMTGLLLATLTAAIGSWVGARRVGIAQALFFGSYAIGAGLAVVLGGYYAEFVGWRSICWAVAVGGLILATASGTLVTSERIGSLVERPKVTRGNQLVSFRYSAAYAAYVGGYLALAGLLPYQLERWGWPAGLAGLSLALTTATFLVGSCIWSLLTDSFGKRSIVYGVTMLLTRIIHRPGDFGLASVA